MAFTSLGFVSLDYLLPRLVEYQRRAIATLERDVATLKDAEARGVVQRILDLKRDHLKQLETLVAPVPQTV
jgi:hypothetical protein